MTDKEIEDNQLFFEQCAKDYREQAIRLMGELISYLDIEVNKDFPLLSFDPLKLEKRSMGSFGEWSYYLHGCDCGFTHKETKQVIEASLIHGEEYGALDPYFFSRYLKSTTKYFPLPVEILENYEDGKKIIEKMIELGKFERINSGVANKYAAIVRERKKPE